MRRRLTEARRGALQLVRLLAAQFPDAGRVLRPVEEELTRLLKALESMNVSCGREIEALARQDGRVIRQLETILLCRRPAAPSGLGDGLIPSVKEDVPWSC